MLSKALFSALIVLLAGATGGSADDLCFLDTTFGNLFVAKNLTLPTADNCKIVNGFLAVTFDPIFGNVCKAHSNLDYVFNLQFNVGGDAPGFAPFYLYVPTLSGAGAFYHPDFRGINGNVAGFNIHKVPCPATRHFGP
ncbi:MAG: hypothetical protein C5B48_16235 [Candidatus Rokuibacteriota bacterium]|nr:MAG: hypothetical protein C5B48_16235 [Candidatus Rokubacteria bacterium]